MNREVEKALLRANLRRRIAKGEGPGHPFRGNQYTGGKGGHAVAGGGATTLSSAHAGPPDEEFRAPPLAGGLLGADDPNEDYGGQTARERFGNEAADAALAVEAQSRQIEPTVTLEMQRIASTIPGAELDGLDHRLKGSGSLTRKIATDAKNDGISIQESAAKVSDSIRFTFIIGEEGHAAGVQNIIRTLQSHNYTIESSRVKNFWRRGDDYNGINMKVRHPSGREIEIQIQTPASKAAKKATHPIYEKERLMEGPSIERWLLQTQMVGIADSVKVPSGILDIGTLVHNPPVFPMLGEFALAPVYASLAPVRKRRRSRG